MEEHPGPEMLRRFVAGELPQEEARKVMAHVLQGCQLCSEEASRYNLLRLSRTSRPASASVSSPGCVTAEARPSSVPVSWTARSRM